MQDALKLAIKHLMVWLGCIHISCGPLGFLQIIAWSTMLASYSMEDGLSRGITDTFSGDRPCSMCLKIENASKRSDRAPEAPKPERTPSNPHLPQAWQPPCLVHLDLPDAHDLGSADQAFTSDQSLISSDASGPEPPPPRRSQVFS